MHGYGTAFPGPKKGRKYEPATRSNRMGGVNAVWIGALLALALVLVVWRLRRATRKIDRIMTEELDRDDE